jgi:hypothetical protein
MRKSASMVLYSDMTRKVNKNVRRKYKKVGGDQG